jgi:hypothetical protein
MRSRHRWSPSWAAGRHADPLARERDAMVVESASGFELDELKRGDPHGAAALRRASAHGHSRVHRPATTMTLLGVLLAELFVSQGISDSSRCLIRRC